MRITAYTEGLTVMLVTAPSPFHAYASYTRTVFTSIEYHQEKEILLTFVTIVKDVLTKIYGFISKQMSF